VVSTAPAAPPLSILPTSLQAFQLTLWKICHSLPTTGGSAAAFRLVPPDAVWHSTPARTNALDYIYSYYHLHRSVLPAATIPHHLLHCDCGRAAAVRAPPLACRVIELCAALHLGVAVDVSHLPTRLSDAPYAALCGKRGIPDAPWSGRLDNRPCAVPGVAATAIQTRPPPHTTRPTRHATAASPDAATNDAT